MKQLIKKRQDVSDSTRGLVKTGTDKWLRQRDLSTDAARTSTVRGPAFGMSRQIRKPLQVGEVIPVARH